MGNWIRRVLEWLSWIQTVEWLIRLVWAGSVGVILGWAGVFWDLPLPLKVLVGLAAATITFILLNQVTEYRAKKKIRLSIRLEMPQQLIQMRPSVQAPIENNGWLFYLHAVKITNRSATDNLSLLFTLHLELNDDLGQPQLSIREDAAGSFMWKSTPQFLCCPINIAPQRTVSGDLGFWVDPITDARLGGNDKRGEDARWV